MASRESGGGELGRPAFRARLRVGPPGLRLAMDVQSAARTAARVGGRLARWRGLILTAFWIFIIELFQSTVQHIPNPPAFLVIIIVFTAFDGGFGPGLASAILSSLYIAYHFADSLWPPRYPGEDLARTLIWAVAFPATAMLVGHLKRQADRTASRLQAMIAAEARREERQAVEEEFRQSEEWFRLIVETAEEGLWVLDSDGRVIYVNGKMATLLGYEREEIIGQTFLEFTGAEHRVEAARYFERRRSGMADRFEFPMRRRDGSDLWFVLSTSPIMDSGSRFLGSLAMFTDITERKRAEDEIRRSNEELERLVSERTRQVLALERRRAEDEQLAATGRMAARIAHEINNPLAGIKNSFLLVSQAVPADHPHREYVRRIDSEIDRIRAIVHGLFDLYRPEQEHPRQFHLSGAAREVAALLEPGLRQRGVSVRIADPPGADEVEFAEGPIRQILFNLIQNAIDASPAGATVEVGTSVAGGTLRLAVCDRGPGISPEDAERIFLPFFTTKRGLERAGLGLGLSLTRSLVDLYRGRIEFVGRPGGGTRFLVEIPLRREDA